MRQLPSLEKLQSVFVYDPETGNVYKKCGCLGSGGYVIIGFENESYPAHRLIWKLETGRDPVGVIDHINGVTSDNRIANLRDVSLSQNSKNNKAVRRVKKIDEEEKMNKLKQLEDMKRRFNLSPP